MKPSDGRGEFDALEQKGSAGFQPVLVGILPASGARIEGRSLDQRAPSSGNGRMPLPAGWKPALPLSTESLR
jgi:hypothetical protein